MYNDRLNLQNLPSHSRFCDSFEEFLKLPVKHVLPAGSKPLQEAIDEYNNTPAEKHSFTVFREIAVGDSTLGTIDRDEIISFLDTDISNKMVFVSYAGNLETLTGDHFRYFYQNGKIENDLVPVKSAEINEPLFFDLGSYNEKTGDYILREENGTSIDFGCKVEVSPADGLMADLIRNCFYYGFDYSEKMFVRLTDEAARGNYYRLKKQYEIYQVVGNDGAIAADHARLITLCLQLLEPAMTPEQKDNLSTFLETPVSNATLARINKRQGCINDILSHSK